jgi:hypothetical protein
MTALGVVAVYLRSCLADLLDDDEFGASLDNAFDLSVFVPGDDEEVITLCRDLLVFASRQIERAET